MTGYRISSAAELAGFTPSALRFHEGEGLLPAPARSATDYRNNDDAAYTIAVLARRIALSALIPVTDVSRQHR